MQHGEVPPGWNFCHHDTI